MPTTKKKDQWEYVRISLRCTAGGEIEAIKHPQDGAGVVTSFTKADILLKLLQEVTAVMPDDRIGFLS